MAFPGRRGRAAVARLGRRGGILLAFGVVWNIYGYALFTAPPRIGMLLYVDYHHWAYLWFTGGALGIVHAFARRPGRDTLGFVGIVAAPTFWAIGYIHLWLFNNHAGPPVWPSIGIWAALAIATMICAGWPEPGVSR